MAKMKPLEEWVCDGCGEAVGVDDGWLEWRDGDKGAHDFRICHNRDSCYAHDERLDRSDNHLQYFVGPNGLQYLLHMMSFGVFLERRMGKTRGIENAASYSDTIRRLHLPYFAETRLYFDKADEDGFFEGANGAGEFMETSLKTIIDRYGAR